MKQSPMSPQDHRKVLNAFDVTEELPFRWAKVWCPVEIGSRKVGETVFECVAWPQRIFRAEALLIAQPQPDCWLESITVGQECPNVTAGRLPGELFDAGEGRTLGDVIALDPEQYAPKLPVKMSTCDIGTQIRIRISGHFKGVALWGTSYLA